MRLIIDEKKLYEVLREFNAVTGLKVSFLENFEKPIMGVPGKNCELCELKQKNYNFYLKCKDCDTQAALATNLSDDIFIYNCHYHLTEAILPVKSYGRTIGYFLLGQMLVDKKKFIEQNSPSALELELAEKIAVPSLDFLHASAKILSWLAKYAFYNRDIDYLLKDSFELIKNYMETHLAEPISISDICEIFYYSRSSLFTLFKNECNMGVNEYITHLRLEKSKALLKKHKINEAAAMVGIPDNNYFSRLFKQKYSISPSEYKQQRK